MATAKKSTKEPKIYYIDYSDDYGVMQDFGVMTYKQAVKAATTLLQDMAADGCGRYGHVDILKKVTVVKPKSEQIEIVVQEIK